MIGTILRSCTLGIVFGARVLQAQSILDLGTLKWTVSNGFNVSTNGSLPSQAHLDLYAAGIISDPLYGENDINQLWVERSNWTYTSSPITGLNDNASTWLVFDGLDTFTVIELCGQAVGNADNQFRQWYFDITTILASCSAPPVLSLNFGSAAKIVLEIAATGDSTINFDNSVGGEFSGKTYMRKEQNDFGWDWSPAIAPAGPWKPAYAIQLKPNDPIYVRNALIDIYRQGQMNNLPPDQSQPFVFNASIDYLGQLPPNATLELVLEDANNATVLSVPLQAVYQNNETITGSVVIDSSKVGLWWPAGHGPQNLYHATITIKDGAKDTIATVERRVGFRTIVLNLSPISDVQTAQGIAPGANWHFEINGHELYAKGSNLVPPDVFWPRVNETKMRHLFEMVVAGNQNMLRVWSSGVYLPDFAYDIADEMGILLWSEFQFSDGVYPTDPSYLKNYEAEAYQNVRRVNHHPSLALWAGGNELESIELAFFFNADTPGTTLKKYQMVFEELLIKCVYANTRSISYIPSSTYFGWLELDFDSVRPQSPRYHNTSGPDALYTDTDNYNYDGSTAFNLQSYPVGRFADEFGFMSMPSLQSWQEVVPENQLNFDSDQVVHRNRHYPFYSGNLTAEVSREGIAQMTSAVKLWYPQPNKADPVANFSAWAWSTQIFQADYMMHELAFYRRGSAMPERQLGALYWQLEDLWVAPTWSSIEANGRQKALYYVAKDMFNPVIIAPYFDATTEGLEVWVTSDLWSTVEGTAHFSWVDWTGNHLTHISPSSNSSNGSPTFDVPFTIGETNSTRVLSYSNITSTLQQWSAAANGNPKTSVSASNAFLRLSITATSSDSNSAGSSSSAESYTHISYFHPTALANSALLDPGLKLASGSGYGVYQTSFTVTATTAVAAWVWLDYQTSQVQGYFEQNGFWLLRGESRTVGFKHWNDWTENGSWIKGVTVSSMWNNTLS